MSKKKPKLISNPLSVEVIHWSLNDITSKNIECQPKTSESIAKDLKQIIRKSDYKINTVKLNSFKANVSSNGSNSYEDDRVFRFNGSIECENCEVKEIKKTLANICGEEKLRNTLFSLNSETITWLSGIDRLIPHQQFNLNTFSFGSLIDLTRFVDHYNSNNNGLELNVAKDDITADFSHDKKRLALKFRLTNGGNNGKHTKNFRYKLEYEYLSINSLIVSFDNNVMRIYFNLNHPPLLFKVETDQPRKELFVPKNRDRHKQKVYKNNEVNYGVHNNEVPNSAFWLRENEFRDCEPETIGKSSVLMVEIRQIINENNLKDKYKELPDPWRLLYVMKRFLRVPIYFANITSEKCFGNHFIREKLINNISLPFAIKYAYHSVFSHTFQASDELLLKKESNQFNQKVEDFAKIDANAVEETLFELSALIDRSAIFRTIRALETIFNNFKTRNEKLKNEKLSPKFNIDTEQIRRCILTPTRLLILPPQPTLKSRFIVNSDPDFTIRLSVREDDLQGLSYSVRNTGSRESQNKFLEKVIKARLMKGVRFGDRLFEFLGSSSSQLRDSGMVLYARDNEGRTAASIRDSTGDMKKIKKNVAKYVARLGLAFSQVMTHIDISENTVIEVKPDIEGPFIPDKDKPGEMTEQRYIFSDGIGMISVDLAKRVYEKLKIECKNNPSAMQIRFGGCKGMLVINPNLKGEHIIFRESMKKYESDDRMLGVLKLSAPRPLYLNRPFITILEQLKVEPKIFLSMLMENLKNLANSLLCECSAATLLQNSSTLAIPYRKLYKSGIPFLSEPIFRQMVDCAIHHRISELKLKARIRVPMSCGRIVFGVLDETDSLDYGRVFVQLSCVDEDYMPKDTCEILKGEIMVTKFPCLHPGDVRKFEAVDIEKLHHIKDCIVFPAKGKRPHPDEMAGSDLDGDEYAVIWNSNLIFEGKNKEAMLFPTSKAKELSHEAEVEDVLDFYCDYILSNNVGPLASAHLANADLLKDGIFSDICMSLANKYAVSLDFAKTGKVERMEWQERPKLYPDFMEKFSQKRTYLSRNVLGQLYRHCDRFSLAMESKADLKIKIEPNAFFKLEGWEKYEKSATDAFKAYRVKIYYLLNRFGVDSEATLISGTYGKTNKYMTGRQETNDIHDLVEKMVDKVFIEFKDRFNNECERDRSNEEERKLRASAWYLIPFKLNEDSNDQYFGFSWTIAEEFCKLIKPSGKADYSQSDHDCIRFSTALIDDYFEKNFVYKEPQIDESVTDESERRQMIMEERFKTAEVVLKAWLERQDHLFFKRKVNRRVVSSTDQLMSDMDRKLRRKLMAMRTDVMFEARTDLTKPLRSAGSLVIGFFKDSIEQWLSVSSLTENNRIIDTPLVKFGFSALLTLNHFFKTRQISHIIDLSPRFQVSLKAPIIDNTFYIALPDESWCKPFVEYIVQNNEEFIEKLRDLSGAIEIKLEPYPINRKKLSHYYLLTASGTVWSLQTIKNFIIHPLFHKIVANDSRWCRRNLWCRGMPDQRNNS